MVSGTRVRSLSSWMGFICLFLELKTCTFQNLLDGDLSLSCLPEISKEEDRRSSDTLDVKTKEKKKKKSIEKSVDISEETDETVEEEQKEEEEEGEEDGSGGEEEEEDGKEEDKECVEEEEEVEQVEEEEDKGKKGKMKKLMNQFNFCERGSLTYNNPYRVSTRGYFRSKVEIYPPVYLR